MKIPTAVLALMVLVAGLLTAAPASADPASEVTVVWPEVTRFNPTTYSYNVTVTNTGDGHLFYTWGSVGWQTSATLLPETGQIDLPYDATQVVRIWSCATEQWSYGDACLLAATSPELDVASRLWVHPEIYTGNPIGPGPKTVWLNYWPKARETETPSATWELVDADDRAVDPPINGTVSAAALAAAGPDTPGEFTVVVPKTLPSGTYYLDVHMSVDTADFGPLEGASESSVWSQFYLDSTPPDLRVRQVASEFYPVRDGYRDVLAIAASNDEYSDVVFQVIDKAGSVRYRRKVRVGDDAGGDTIYWDGQDNQHRPVPAGTYALRLSTADRVGNTSVWNGTTKVSHKQLRWKEFERTVTAANSRIGKPFVGRCARLAAPASGGPRGSLGFYSDAGCRGSSEAHAVVTNHGVHIPQAFHHLYRTAQVTLNGGPASTSGSNYIVLGYLSPRGRLLSKRVLTNGNGAHPGYRLPLDHDFFKYVWDRETSKPYIVWSNGLTAGSQYDVRSYTVQVRYRVLR